MIPFKKLNKLQFPEYTGIKVNMMPIIMGDANSIPTYLHQYIDMINSCKFKKGDIVYLSIHESIVEKGDTQRRTGIHTDATKTNGWGGPWGSIEEDKGIYMASTDGRCKIWNCLFFDVDDHGGIISQLDADNELMEENTMYWLGDRTPHESLPAVSTGQRQWFRLVSPAIGIWFSKHNTPNPLGVLPKAPITDQNKF